jgi:REase associating with pPIWI_RE
MYSIMDPDDVFLYLVAGVTEAFYTGSRSQSALLRQALNKFTALQMVNRIQPHSSLSAILEDLEEPIMDWWPGQLPNVIQTGEVGAAWSVFFDGSPDEWVEDFLAQKGVQRRFWQSLQELQADIDQSAIKVVQKICRDTPQVLSSIYCTIRRFLIEHPVTTIFELQQALGNFPEIPTRIINSFYEAPDRFERYSRQQGYYWLCPYCHGILNWAENGKIPRCARHSVCGRLHPRYEKRTRLDEKPGLVRLKWGLHRRVCIPGIPEIELYEWVRDQQKCHPPLVTAVDLWPGADQYDLRICFVDDDIWGIDVKDYADPVDLYRKIRKPGKTNEVYFYNQGELKWSQAFFVVPQYRLDWNPHYIEFFKRAEPSRQHALPPNIQIKSIKQFRQTMQQKLARLRKP